MRSRRYARRWTSASATRARRGALPGIGRSQRAAAGARPGAARRPAATPRRRPAPGAAASCSPGGGTSARDLVSTAAARCTSSTPYAARSPKCCGGPPRVATARPGATARESPPPVLYRARRGDRKPDHTRPAAVRSARSSGRRVEDRDLLPDLARQPGAEVLQVVHGFQHDRILQVLDVQRGYLARERQQVGAVVQIAGQVGAGHAAVRRHLNLLSSREKLVRGL